MSGEPKNLQINIMGREFRVTCKPEEEHSLLEAVDYLNVKMQEIKDQGKVNGHERIAIMAALNISHEYLTMRVGGNFDVAQIKRKMNSIERTLDQALAVQNELFKRLSPAVLVRVLTFFEPIIETWLRTIAALLCTSFFG